MPVSLLTGVVPANGSGGDDICSPRYATRAAFTHQPFTFRWSTAAKLSGRRRRRASGWSMRAGPGAPGQRAVVQAVGGGKGEVIELVGNRRRRHAVVEQVETAPEVVVDRVLEPLREHRPDEPAEEAVRLGPSADATTAEQPSEATAETVPNDTSVLVKSWETRTCPFWEDTLKPSDTSTSGSNQSGTDTVSGMSATKELMPMSMAVPPPRSLTRPPVGKAWFAWPLTMALKFPNRPARRICTCRSRRPG